MTPFSMTSFAGAPVRAKFAINLDAFGDSFPSTGRPVLSPAEGTKVGRIGLIGF
jgi:hypothetical protein